MNIFFIGTNTSGYGERGGVKYLTLQKGSGGVVGAGTLDFALLNLGQSADWNGVGLGYTPNNDAADLGDFYQLGRVADGHQKTTWSKNASHFNRIEPYDGVATSAVIDYNDGGTTPVYNSTTHQVEAGKYFGKFISIPINSATTNDLDWYYNGGHDNALWGNGTSNRAGENAAWTYTANNPCPSGWKVPNRYKFWDIFNGNGSNEPRSFSGTLTSGIGTNNTWKWREITNNAIGGTLISNADGEILFLPAAGFRDTSDGTLFFIGSDSYYWSSTCNSTSFAYILYFYSSSVYAGGGGGGKANGYSVRCVAE